MRMSDGPCKEPLANNADEDLINYYASMGESDPRLNVTLSQREGQDVLRAAKAAFEQLRGDTADRIQHLKAKVESLEGDNDRLLKDVGASEMRIDLLTAEIIGLKGSPPQADGQFVAPSGTLEDACIRHVAAIVHKHDGNKTAIAKELDVSMKTVYNWVHKIAKKETVAKKMESDSDYS